MSGVVEGAKEVANKVIPVANPIAVATKTLTRNAPDFIKNDKFFGRTGVLNQFDNLADLPANTMKGITSGQGITQGLKPIIANSKQTYGKVMGEIKGEQAPLPTVAPQDPAAAADADRKAKIAAKRKAHVDLLTDRPGRGGILA